MIRVEQLSKSLGGREILHDLSFEVGPGLTALLGANGAGKSTLLRILSGIWQPDAGAVTIGGHPLTGDALEAKRLLGYQPEFPELHPSITPRRHLEFIAYVRGVDAAQLREQCDAFGVAELLDTPVERLSQGQKRLTTLVAAVMHEPAVLLLDEPTNSLDPHRVARLRTLLAHERAGRTQLVSTHQLDFISTIADRYLILAEGRLAAGGTMEALRASGMTLEQLFLGL